VETKYLGVTIISGPGGSEGLLSTQIPHDEVYVVPNHFFNVRADSRRRVYDLVHQKLIQYGGFARVVETNDDDLVFCDICKHNTTLVLVLHGNKYNGETLTFGTEVAPYFREQEAHGGRGAAKTKSRGD